LASDIEKMVLHQYGQMEHKNGVSMARDIELTALPSFFLLGQKNGG
jgi:hypothetical protein